MKRIKCTTEDIIKEIKFKNIFEVRLNNDTQRLTECVTSVSFSKLHNMIFISFIDGKTVNDNYDLLMDLTDSNISSGINIILGESNGDIITRFQFENCILKDYASIILNYSDNSNFQTKQYIAVIEYSNIYMIK